MTSTENERRFPILQGIGVSLTLFAGIWLFEIANGHTEGIAELLVRDGQPRTMTILILLSGFIQAASVHSRYAFRRELNELSPRLTCTPDERAEILGPDGFKETAASAAAALVCALSSTLVIRREGGVPAVLDSAPLDHHLVAGLAVNMILFGLMGRGMYWSLRFNRTISTLESVMPPVDLFDLGTYTPFARHGLRGAVLWLGGSSIASLLFIDQGHDLVTAAIIAGTVGLGTYSLFWPLRGVHRTISRAKGEELERVRALLRSLRKELLDDSSQASLSASQRIPGLLAYEARIAAVREWPMDVPTLVRFVILVAVAVGSWLGGAVVEMLLGSVMEG